MIKEYYVLQMDSIKEKCSKYNWDGNGAEAVSPLVIERATRFASLLPDSIEQASVSCDADGHIHLEWSRRNYSIMTIIISHGPKIVFSCIHGALGQGGIEHYDEQSIPSRILKILEEHFGV